MHNTASKISTLKTVEARAELAGFTVTEPKAQEALYQRACHAARSAAVLAARQTPLLIAESSNPPLDEVEVSIANENGRVRIDARLLSVGRDALETHALSAAAMAAVAFCHVMREVLPALHITGIEVTEATGAPENFMSRFASPPRAAVLIISEAVCAGAKPDTAGAMVVQALRENGLAVTHYDIIPEDMEEVVHRLLHYADEDALDLVVTTGGTGFGSDDCTPEAMQYVLQREAPGISEAARSSGQHLTPFAALSRGRAGLRGKTLMVNLPGSRRGVAEALPAVLPAILHALKRTTRYPEQVESPATALAVHGNVR